MLKKVLKIILIVIYILSIILFSYFIFKLNIIPLKYLLIGYIIFILFSILFIYLLKKIPILGAILMVIISILLTIISIYLNNTNEFLNRTQTSKYATITYQIITLNNDSYNNIKDLKNKKIAYLENNKDNIKDVLSKKIDYEEIIREEFGSLQNDLYNKSVEALCIEESYLNLIKEEVEDFSSKTKSIYSFKLIMKMMILLLPKNHLSYI